MKSYAITVLEKELSLIRDSIEHEKKLIGKPDIPNDAIKHLIGRLEQKQADLTWGIASIVYIQEQTGK